MKPVGFLLIIAILLSIVPIVQIPKANAEVLPISDVDNAIDEGVTAVINGIKHIYWNGQYYDVMSDHPSPTISVVYNGQTFIPGSFFDPGDLKYKAKLIDVSSNFVSWRYYFNVDSDRDYDVVIYASLTNVDKNTDKLFINVEKSEYTITLLVGTNFPYKYTNVNQGWSTTITIDDTNRFKFLAARYVARHSTRIAAWLMEEEGYTSLANKLNAFMDNLGFQYDVYAPLFGKSNNYPDDFFDYAKQTWLGNGYDAHPWNTDPNGYYINYPYKSRMYILDKAGFISVGINGWEQAPLAKLLKALHLLNKYGTSKQSDAENLISEAMNEGDWDGYGLKGYTVEGFHLPYKGYPVYPNAVFLATLVKYYQVTGDRYINGNDILYIADRLAGILVALQWNYESETPWGTVKLALFNGWWPASYDIGSIIAKPSAWGLIDTATAGLDSLSGAFARYLGVNFPPAAYRPMPTEFPFSIVNSESTIIAVQALIMYRQLNRNPINPQSEISGIEGVFVDGGGGGSGPYHSGDYSDDGRWVSAYALTPGLGGDAWHYEYVKFKVKAATTASYKLRVDVMLNYNGYDSAGSVDDVYLVIKLIGSSGNVIQEIDNHVDSVNKNNVFSIAKAFTGDYNIGTLSSGTYYIEIGIKVVANNEPASFNGAWINAVGHIDYAGLIPSS